MRRTVVATPVSKIAKTSTMIVDATVVEQSVGAPKRTNLYFVDVTDPRLIAGISRRGCGIPTVRRRNRRLSMWIPGATVGSGRKGYFTGRTPGNDDRLGLKGKYGVQKYEGALMAAPSFGGVDLSKSMRTVISSWNQISVCLPLKLLKRRFELL